MSLFALSQTHAYVHQMLLSWVVYSLINTLLYICRLPAGEVMSMQAYLDARSGEAGMPADDFKQMSQKLLKVSELCFVTCNALLMETHWSVLDR